MTVRIYRAFNGPAPTTAAQAGTTTGTAIKTHLQLLVPSTFDITIMGWGISFNGSAAAAGVPCELIQTGTVAATVTAHVAAGLAKVNVPTGAASQLTLSTSGTGYNASAEGTITSTVVHDAIFLQPTGTYAYRFPLGQEPVVAPSQVLRIRTTSAASVSCYCYIDYSE